MRPVGHTPQTCRDGRAALDRITAAGDPRPGQGTQLVQARSSVRRPIWASTGSPASPRVSSVAPKNTAHPLARVIVFVLIGPYAVQMATWALAGNSSQAAPRSAAQSP